MSISSSYSFLKKTFTYQNITSLFLRAVVVIVRPILIIIAALYSETFAGKLGFYFILSAVITSSLSFAYYREYMQQAVNFGFSNVIKDINKHSLLTTFIISTIGLLIGIEYWIIFSFIFEFYFHQVARVYLYRKEFLYWGLYSFIIPFSFIFFYYIFSLLEEDVIFLFTLSISILSFVSLFLIRLPDFLKSIWSNSLIFGISRKIYMQADKLIIGFLIAPESFWILAILYQISNAAMIIFDTFIVMPNKKKIVKNVFIYDSRYFLKFNFLITIFIWLTIVMSILLFSKDNIFFYFLFSSALALRIFGVNLFNIKLEMYFWKFDLFKISKRLLIIIVVISLITLISFSLFSDKIVIFLTTLIFLLSTALMNNYLNNFLFKLNTNEDI